MSFLVSFIIIFIGLINHYSKKTWISPDVLFCYEWGLITLFASLRLFGLYSASTKTWLLIILGTMFFLMGSHFGQHLKINDVYRNSDNNTLFISKKIFWLLVALLFIYNCFELYKTISAINLGYSLGDIREASVGMREITGYSRNTGGFYELLSLFFNVIEVFVVAIGIEAFISDFRRNWKMFVGIFSVEIVNAFSTGSRFTVFYLLIELLVCIGFYKYCGKSVGIQISKRLKIWVKRVIVILGAIVIVLTLIRGAKLNEIFEKYYRYLCGNIIFLDLHIKQLDNSGFLSLGYAGLYGLFSLILPYLNSIGFNYPNLYLKTISEVLNTQDFLQIGDKLYTNAFITPFYHLYADFRFLGVAFGMFIFGVIAGKVYRRALIERTHTRITFYLIICQMLFKTLQLYPLSMKPYIFSIVIILFYKKIRIGKIYNS